MNVDENLVNQAGFARALGVSGEFVRQLRLGNKPGPTFPVPAYEGRELLWGRGDVLAYVEARKKYLEPRSK